MRLAADYISQFKRDKKRLEKGHVNLDPLYELIDLVLLNTPEALVIRSVGNGLAVFQRTGSHDEVFRQA